MKFEKSVKARTNENIISPDCILRKISYNNTSDEKDKKMISIILRKGSSNI